MRRYLIVANQTLAGEHVLEEVRRLTAQEDSAFHVIVPATPVADQWTWTEGEANAIARERLEQFLARLAPTGVTASGEVGDRDPLQAIRDALRDESYEGIVLSTLPPGISRWLGMDIVSRVERTFDLPVIHIVGQPAPT